MKKIPEEFIEAMPDRVEATRESCEAAVDPALLVLFLMAGQLEPRLEMPPIVANGHELWPLPAPWGLAERNQIRLLLDLNGAGDNYGYLEHVRRNALEYNEALEDMKPDIAAQIARMTPGDASHVWEYLNALAASVADDIYQTLPLSPECKQAFYIAKGLGS